MPGKWNGKVDVLMWRAGNISDGVDEGFKNIAQRILKPQNLPEQLRVLADSPPAEGHPSIPDIMAEAYVTHFLPGKILEAIRTKSRWMEIKML